jgi:ABC-2 type transport system permease protein
MSVFTDTWLVFTRALRLSLRNPVWSVIGVIQPIIYLVLFGPLLEPLASAPGFPAGDPWVVFTPGLLIQLALFGSAFVGFAIVAELREGVVERMRVTPVSRIALLLGRVQRDVVVLLVQSAILVGFAVAVFGLRPDWAGLGLCVLLVTLLGALMASLSYALGLTLKSEDALAPLLNGISVPILLLSGILLPMSLAPDWLYAVSRANPLAYVVDAARALFAGDLAAPAVVTGFAVTLACAVLAATAGVRTFRRESG